MADQMMTKAASASNWNARQVYLMAALCLAVGLAIGYLFRGSQSPAASVPAKSSAAASAPSRMPSLDQMRHMAEKKAEPLLTKLKDNPNDAALLVQIGDIYKQTHQFRDAAGFYDRSLKVDPKNAGVRSDLASALYYSGDTEHALDELQEALKYDAHNAAVLFNLGMIRWQGKKDSKGAIAAWQTLLKENPKLPADRKAAVERLIAQVQQVQKENR